MYIMMTQIRVLGFSLARRQTEIFAETPLILLYKTDVYATKPGRTSMAHAVGGSSHPVYRLGQAIL